MRRLLIGVMVVGTCLLGQQNPLIREEQTVVVDGVSEVWRLEWKNPPQPACHPAEDPPTCPCLGFAYGEGGDLDLVRLRAGAEFERLHLTPFFRAEAIVQRWALAKTDYDTPFSPAFAQEVARRPTVQIMHFEDYDHDGWRTEFYLQTEAVPCGKSNGIVVGVSRLNPKLHAFGTALHPRKPLTMLKNNWEDLRKAKRPVDSVEWTCGDHGSETQTNLRLSWTPRGIAGSTRTYACPPGGRLLSESPM